MPLSYAPSSLGTLRTLLIAAVLNTSNEHNVSSLVAAAAIDGESSEAATTTAVMVPIKRTYGASTSILAEALERQSASSTHKKHSTSKSASLKVGNSTNVETRNSSRNDSTSSSGEKERQQLGLIADTRAEREPYVGVRLRFNEPFFEEAARLFYNVFSYEVQSIKIAPQKQCFPEGCFRLHSFKIAGFQRPKATTLRPLAPNLLLLNIFSFDVDINGLLNGNIQLLLTAVPVAGHIAVSARQLSLSAAFDLQKTQHRVPFIRMQSCDLRSGFVSTQVSDLGLLTDSINLKYRAEMVTKAKEMITTTICENIDTSIRAQVNERLRQMPRAISVADILRVLIAADEEEACKPTDGQRCEITIRVPAAAANNNRGAAPLRVNVYTNQYQRRRGGGGNPTQRNVNNRPLYNDYYARRQSAGGHQQQYRYPRQEQRRHVGDGRRRRRRRRHDTLATTNDGVNDEAEGEMGERKGVAMISEIIPDAEHEEEEVEEAAPPTIVDEQEREDVEESFNDDYDDRRHFIITTPKRPAQFYEAEPITAQTTSERSASPMNDDDDDVENFILQRYREESTSMNSKKRKQEANKKQQKMNKQKKKKKPGSDEKTATTIADKKQGGGGSTDNGVERSHTETTTKRTGAKMKEKTTTDRNNTTTDAVRVEFNKETTPKTLASDGELATLLDFLDMSALSRVYIDLDFLDSSSGVDSFGIGLNGDVFLRTPQHAVSYVGGGVREILAARARQTLNRSAEIGGGGGGDSREKKTGGGGTTASRSYEDMFLDEVVAEDRKTSVSVANYSSDGLQPLPKLRFPNATEADVENSNGTRTLELLFSELESNLVLLQAHRARLLQVRVRPTSALFGHLLKTSCSADEVCLSDSIPEVAERYPSRQLELKLETVQPPRISIGKELARLSFIGAASFYLADTCQPIGRIPFTSVMEIRIRMEAKNRLNVNLTIARLELLDDLDFFELPATTLSGFRDAVKGAVENAAHRLLSAGLDMTRIAHRLERWGLSDVALALMDDGLVLMRADVDVYRLMFEDADAAEEYRRLQ